MICNISKNSSFALLNYLWSNLPFYNFQSVDYHPRWEREHKYKFSCPHVKYLADPKVAIYIVTKF